MQNLSKKKIDDLQMEVMSNCVNVKKKNFKRGEYILSFGLHQKVLGVIGEGKADKTDNVLKNAPHTHRVLTADEWTHAYPRSKAAYPLDWVAENKFWPQVGRVDDGYGDRNLVCSCCILYDKA